jgi:hypothetical protein
VRLLMYTTEKVHEGTRENVLLERAVKAGVVVGYG